MTKPSLFLTVSLAQAVFGQKVTEFTVPTPDSYPLGIVQGANGAMWFTEEDANKIAELTIAGNLRNMYSLPPTPIQYR